MKKLSLNQISRKDQIKIIFFIILGIVAVSASMFTSPYVTSVLFTVLMYIGLVGAWNILSGFTGYLFLGSAAFYGLGAYTFSINVGSFSIYTSILLAFLVCFVVGFLIGIPFLKIRGAYFAIATYALTIILGNTFLYYEQVFQRTTGRLIPAINTGTLYPYLALTTIGILIFAFVIKKTKFGYGLLTIKGNERVANTIGINTFLYKNLAFALCASLTGLIAAITIMRGGYIDTSIAFNVDISFYVLVMGLFGGRGFIAGGVISATIISLLLELFGTAGNPQIFMISLGILLFVVIYFLPNGLEGLLKRIKEFT